MNTDRYQGICLVSEEGWRNMNTFDNLPPPVRRRLARSPFNLCPMCVMQHVVVQGREDVMTAIAVIHQFEDYVRREGVT